MAKSLRSKRQREMRNAKRERNAPKELAKLKKVLGTEGKLDIKALDGVKVSSAKKIKEDQEKKKEQEEGMDVDRATPKYNPKTKRDENGQYPVWMNQRKIRQHKHKGKHSKKGKKKQSW